MASAQKPVGAGTGAFKFVEWVKNDHITLERNPNYWKKDAAGTQLPYLDKITYRPIADATVLLANIKTGDLDAIVYHRGERRRGVKSGNDLATRTRRASGSAASGSTPRSRPSTRRNSGRRSRRRSTATRSSRRSTSASGRPGRGRSSPPVGHMTRISSHTAAALTRRSSISRRAASQTASPVELLIASGSPTTTQLAQLVKDQVAKVGINLTITQEEGAKQSADQNDRQLPDRPLRLERPYRP